VIGLRRLRPLRSLRDGSGFWVLKVCWGWHWLRSIWRYGDVLARSRSTSLIGLELRSPSPRMAPWDMTVRQVPRGAEAWAERGFKGVKAKIGYASVQEDIEVVRAIRKAIGDEIAIMVDYNQCLTPIEAVRRIRALDGEGLT
jgi:mandelate racemase